MSKEREEKIAEISEGCLGIDLNILRQYHQLLTVNIKQALQLAYNAGRDACEAEHIAHDPQTEADYG